MVKTKVVVLLSGGLDSATVAARALADGCEVIALSFNYGQRNSQELGAARLIAAHFGIDEHFIVNVDLSAWGGSLLTGGQAESEAVPPSGRSNTNYVPGRNTVFIALALSLAEAKGAEAIHLGFTAADRRYPDTGLAYLDAFGRLLNMAGRSTAALRLVAPLIDDNKASIVQQALDHGVPIALTWSCYAEGAQPCGACVACTIRDRALILTGRADLATAAGRQMHAEEADAVSKLLWRFMLRDAISTGRPIDRSGPENSDERAERSRAHDVGR